MMPIIRYSISISSFVHISKTTKKSQHRSALIVFISNRHVKQNVESESFVFSWTTQFAHSLSLSVFLSSSLFLIVTLACIKLISNWKQLHSCQHVNVDIQWPALSLGPFTERHSRKLSGVRWSDEIKAYYSKMVMFSMR